MGMFGAPYDAQLTNRRVGHWSDVELGRRRRLVRLTGPPVPDRSPRALTWPVANWPECPIVNCTSSFAHRGGLAGKTFAVHQVDPRDPGSRACRPTSTEKEAPPHQL